ncbi:hypothetical protein SJAG_00709 [Schizosaccharomyces japonicus yFS275]|uniref:Uncharacterized protein n=1 Tax=Schizosaccharomyces japonicus (strain yFS275 / FY16936) TaxID=402676 RepID=B6JWD5_SCHJY|nr:hypothetical protein SJAG_00709 [Schizosaccharomyces japonicus yFS275]EEB05686.1 hypothetical protein SJAG_00709 [Schizosaccharomyces japonicus yFS275]
MKLNFLNINLLLLLQFFHKAAADATFTLNSSVTNATAYIKPSKGNIGEILLNIDPSNDRAFSYLLYGPGTIGFSLGDDDTPFAIHTGKDKVLSMGIHIPYGNESLAAWALLEKAGEYSVVTRSLYSNETDYQVKVSFNDSIDGHCSAASRTGTFWIAFSLAAAVFLSCFNLSL